ncbi:transporter [Azoarcus sp. DD4]|uniref:BON domain-containing protein n=1 Tax=Azoarcus sp. DD4 TaxID=2027405 RepID=UPI001128A5D2|nr:BON domain-containing protein [Azoarcus sp. DD4]QDF95721.1 transporter [Azoarcus sp. DD4]
MRKSIRASLGIAAMLAALSACSGTPTRESTGEYLDDSAITAKVKSAFVQDKTVSALQIKVETFKGSVQLSGYADHAAEAQRAVELARDVPGVKSVKNDIRLKSN